MIPRVVPFGATLVLRATHRSLHLGSMGGTQTTQWTPISWFLVTPPQPKPGSIRRHRLDLLLESASSAGMTAVVMAPSGFGKTTALAAWAQSTTQTVAWLTLTRHESTSAQVLSGILSALQRVAREVPGFHSFLEILPDASDSEMMLERISRALRELPSPLTMVIDDAHLTAPDFVEDILDVLSEHSGRNLRCVVAGTRHLDHWFNTHLATGSAVLIGYDALAMTIPEITELAKEPSAAASAAIHEATNGWPVAIRIALNNTGANAAGGLDAVPPRDGGLLAEYIARTVLRDLRGELVDFILAATTCSRVSADLVGALSGRSDAAALLNECVRLGLFLDRYIDGEQDPVYRWHEVFARHCRIVASETDEASVRRRNLIAAEWLQQLYPTEATVHAMRASAPKLAARILQDHWVRLIVEAGSAPLNAQCLALPPEWRNTPEILLIRACCLDAQGDTTGASLVHARAQSILDADGFEPSEQLRLTRSFADLFLAQDHQSLSRAADQVHAELRRAHPGNTSDTHGLFLLGWVELRLRRDPATTVRLLASAHRDAVASGNHVLATRVSQNLLFAYSFGGYFTAAQELMASGDGSANGRVEAAGASGTAGASGSAVDAGESLAWQHYDGGIEYVARGWIEYWHNDLAGAETSFRSLIQQGGHPTSYAAMARVYFALSAAATGDSRLIAEALPYLSGVSTVEAHGVPWPAYRTIAAALLAAASGDYPRALALIEPIRDADSIPVTSVLMADLYRKAGHPGSAMQMISKMPLREQASYVRVTALVTTAVISMQSGEQTRAHQLLERALDTAAPEGIARPFNAGNADQPLRDLLAAHAAWGTAHEGFLAAQITLTEPSASANRVIGVALSPREREVLGHLRTTMTAEEIASALHVSVNTVRTHQRAIYRKLGVKNRRDAIKLRV